jgi:putative membrane protein
MKDLKFLTKENISIAIIWIFHVSGIIGIIYGDSQWFVSATPLNLSLSFILLIWNTELNLKVSMFIVFCFFAGILVEIIGVNYGFIFGSYHYGEMLGYKIMGVPILIGFNWCILVFTTASISKQFFNKRWKQILLGVSLMIFVDLLMEPIAPVLDYWTFENGIASCQNYLGWAIISLPLQLLFHKIKVNIENSFSFNLYLLQVLFFTILLIKIKTLGV